MQGFAHILDPTPNFSPFFCACTSGDFSQCLDPANCNIPNPGSTLLPDHLRQQQTLPPSSHPFQTFTPPIQIPTHSPHHSASPSTSSTITTSASSFHSSPSPLFSNQPSAINQQRPPDKTCLWSDCHAVFPSTGDLLAHLSTTHIPSTEIPQEALQANLPTSCLWDDCSVFPNLSSIPGASANPGPAAVTNFLTTHLLQDHLGLQRPPHLSPQTPVIASLGSVSPALSHSTGSPTLDPGSEEEITTQLLSTPVLPQVISVSPLNDPRTLAVSERSTHACLWVGCNDVFPTCDALTAHIAAAHVGSGKAQYECQWRGCSRTGAQPFASKQKILRHLQSHTGS